MIEVQPICLKIIISLFVMLPLSCENNSFHQKETRLTPRRVAQARYANIRRSARGLKSSWLHNLQAPRAYDIFNMIDHPRGSIRERYEAVGMLPGSQWAGCLGVGEPMRPVNIRMNGNPMDREWAEPQRKAGTRAFTQGLDLAQLHDYWRRGQLLQHLGAVMKISYGLQWGVDNESNGRRRPLCCFLHHFSWDWICVFRAKGLGWTLPEWSSPINVSMVSMAEEGGGMEI